MVKLYRHQKEIVDKNPPRALLAHGLGTGKTITALSLAKKNGVTPLIVVPKMLLEKWGREAVMVGVEAHIMTKEQFRKHAKTIRRYDAVIIDEAHFGFGSMKSQLHKAMYWYLATHKVTYRWFLTGTPYTSTPWSVYSIARLLGHVWSYTRFREAFFQERWLGRRTIWEPKEGIEEDVANLVRKIGSIVRLDECIDVPEQIVEVETFPLTKAQKDKYKEVKDKEPNPLARFTKYHQIANGFLLGNEFEPLEEFDSFKNQWIAEKVTEVRKAIVFCRYNHHLTLFSKLIPKRTYIINGATEERDEIIAEAEKDDECVVLINASCSVGYELPSFDTVFYASLSYSYVDFEQSKGRVLRINNPHGNLYVVCNTAKSADEAIWQSVQKKQNFSETIFAREKLPLLESEW